MADGVTPNYGLLKPEINASDNTWGAKINANFDEIDTAIKAVADTIIQPDGIGDFFDTARDMDSKWLRRNGALYDSADYPGLAAIMPALADSVEWDTEPANAIQGGYGIVQAEGRITAVFTNATTTAIIASVDGGDWNVRHTFAGSVQNGRLAYGAGVFVMVDGNGKRATSPDGDTWSTADFLDTGTIGCLDICYGNGIFVAVGLRDGGGGGIWTSADGVSWVERTSGSTYMLQGVDFVNDVFVAVGINGTILTSTDGITWTPRTSGVTTQLNSTTFLDGLYVIVGHNGAVLTSSNLAGWTPRTSGVATDLFRTIATSTTIIAVGESGTAIISADGISWTPTITGLSADIYAVIYDSVDDNLFYAVGGLTSVLYGVRTLATQFRVPDDNPTYGWIRALT